MIGVSLPGGGVTSYKNDKFGRRIEKMRRRTYQGKKTMKTKFQIALEKKNSQRFSRAKENTFLATLIGAIIFISITGKACATT
ncbi:hypothetical protein KIH13_16665 [Pseudomonas viridiflava]|nr:hypothetical protein KIH13_16665 [Pseudomonas viridiflava]